MEKRNFRRCRLIIIGALNPYLAPHPTSSYEYPAPQATASLRIATRQAPGNDRRVTGERWRGRGGNPRHIEEVARLAEVTRTTSIVYCASLISVRKAG